MMRSYLTSLKIPFKEEDGHLIKAFQMEKHCTAVNCSTNLRTETAAVINQINFGK